jgi:hypothetical protein
MIALMWFVRAELTSPFKSKSRLEAENAVLRHQAWVQRRSINRRQVRCQATWTSKSGMADLSAKPRSGHCRHGFVRGQTICFELLYGFVIVRIDRRDLVWINVTTNPTAEWIARQITEAFPWDAAPGYMIRDRDRIYGAVGTRRLRAMGIRTSRLHRPHLGRMALPNG